MLCLASLDPLDATAERGERNICTYAYIYIYAYQQHPRRSG